MNADVLSLDMRLLVAFDALLEEGNVTRAAGRLGLTQQAMSGILARLRDVFGDPLFVRARYGITPTPKAEALADSVRDLIGQADALLAYKAFDPSTAEATLRISTLANVQRTLLIPFVARLRELAPLVCVAVVPFEVEELRARMDQRSIDLAITVPGMAPDDLPSRRLFQGKWVCAMARAHPFEGKRLTMKNFLSQKHIVVSPSDLSFRGSADEALTDLGQQRDVVLSVPDFLICCEMIASTDLVAVVPADVANLYEDTLRCYPVPFDVPTQPLITVWPKRLDSDPLHRWAREQLATVAGELRTFSSKPISTP